MIRLNKFIAANTSYSRRKADELIASGEVFINDKKVTQMGASIDEKIDKVKIGKKIVTQKNDKIYLMLNKPAGYVTTRSDELKRKTIMELVPKSQNLKPVGRLDLETEGLIFLSNDGEFINRHTHPKYECDKEYLVKVQGNISDANKNLLERGVRIDKKMTSPCKIYIDKSLKTETFLRIVIHEGRNRQIRKMFAYIKSPVKYLQRIRIGKVQLDSLPKGKYRLLTPEEIDVK